MKTPGSCWTALRVCAPTDPLAQPANFRFCTRITWMWIRWFVHAVLLDFPNYIGLNDSSTYRYKYSFCRVAMLKKMYLSFYSLSFHNENLLTTTNTGFTARQSSWGLASNCHNVKGNIKYCKKLELNQNINRLRLNWQFLLWKFCDDKNQSDHTVNSYLVSDHQGGWMQETNGGVVGKRWWLYWGPF